MEWQPRKPQKSRTLWRMNRFPFFFVAFLILAFGCKTATISYQRIRPSDISLPADVRKVIIVNRCTPDPSTKWMNILEGAFSGEGIKMDRMGAQSCAEELGTQLGQGPKMEVYNAYFDLTGTGTSQFPQPLNMDTVKNMCKRIGADALVVLECFDSDNFFSQNTENRTRTEAGKNIPYTVFVASGRQDVTAGFRVYYGKDGRVLDEFRVNRSNTFRGEGNNYQQAIDKLPSKYNMVQNVGRTAGSEYAMRISPQYEWVGSKYYRKGDRQFKTAYSMLKVGDWEGAKNIWLSLSESSEPSIAGKACYNMGVYYEYNGDLKTAIDWVKKARDVHHFKPSSQYIVLLQNRLNDQLKVEQQLKPGY